MANSYIDGCICGCIPVNRIDINPDCPLHGPLLAIWPTDDSAVNASLADPGILNRVTDPEWLGRAADYLGADEVGITEDVSIKPPPFKVMDHVRLKNRNQTPGLFDYFGDGTNIVVDIRTLSNGRVMIVVMGDEVWPAEDLELDLEHQDMLKRDRSEETRLKQEELDRLNAPTPPGWNKAYDKIQRKVRRACQRSGLRCSIYYSAYTAMDDEDSGLPIDNLAIVALPQRIILVYNPSAYFGNGRLYVSPVLNDPCWIDLAICANAAVHVTDDTTHRYFEDISKVEDYDLKPSTWQKMQRHRVDAIYRLDMGS